MLGGPKGINEILERRETLLEGERERPADQLDVTGRSISKLCFLPKGHLSVGDTVLAQKIALQAVWALM